MAAAYFFLLIGEFVIQTMEQHAAGAHLNRKTRAILVYLAATGETHSRLELAKLFCQDAKDPAGTLRWHISRIRRQLDEQILRVSRHDVTLNKRRVERDIIRLEEAAENRSRASTSDIAQALALYRGPFLDGLSLPDASEFELWLLGERARY